LNEEPVWKKLLNISKDNLFLKAELILRFFAFYDKNKEYDGFLTKFLNDYMSEHRNDSEERLENKKNLFKKTADLIFEKISNKDILPRRTSNAFIEALFFGVANNLSHLTGVDTVVVRRYYQKLNNDKDFSEDSLLEGTMKRQKVAKRLKKSLTIFAGK